MDNIYQELALDNPVVNLTFSTFSGKELFACSLAISSFQSILGTLGGPNEKERARFEIFSQFFTIK
jgi:hypothetical protein